MKSLWLFWFIIVHSSIFRIFIFTTTSVLYEKFTNHTLYPGQDKLNVALAHNDKALFHVIFAGTPADCTSLGLSKALFPFLPDLVHLTKKSKHYIMNFFYVPAYTYPVIPAFIFISVVFQRSSVELT